MRCSAGIEIGEERFRCVLEEHGPVTGLRVAVHSNPDGNIRWSTYTFAHLPQTESDPSEKNTLRVWTSGRLVYMELRGGDGKFALYTITRDQAASLAYDIIGKLQAPIREFGTEEPGT